MTVWTHDINKYTEVYKDKYITKDLSEETYKKIGAFNIIYDLRDLHSIQLLESIDILKNRDVPHVLVSFSIENVKLINAIYATQLQNSDIRKLIYFSIQYDGSDIVECSRVLNVDGIYNIIVRNIDVKILNKIKPEGKGIISEENCDLEYKSGLII